MWDLPMYMGLVGSVAYVAYKLLYRMTEKEKLSASGRWILLRLVMAFYLLPFPLLSEPLKRMIRDLSDKDILSESKYRSAMGRCFKNILYRK